ncbi:SctK family type III secretion system sorting platform protein [Parendozoicomonas haliclonae]|uniref:YOP protein translocation protein K (YscK) n=1 Tax=Parendozoicomonas haliclonae TaxID=1960125 RepID=A0A1X7AF16_9GAMM|nr:SctK family type III secretion system sorting platform protein [Parendozoicomonas haliclonae]SMA36203.1 YOP protein translocation protein K (YscK) [Parendozoicomonas haliclonae]
MDIGQLAPVLEFNFQPAGYIDPSWLASLPNQSAIEFLQSSESGSSWASRHILEAYGLTGHLDLDFQKPEKHLALASRKHLTPIVFHAGLALNGPLLKGIIKRQERQAVESCLGKESYHYAIKKGPFIAGDLPRHIDSGFRIDWNNPDELKKHIFRTGVRLLGGVYGREPDAFQKRLLFKFPMPSKEYFYAGSAAGYSPDVVRLGGIMLRKLMKEFIR